MKIPISVLVVIYTTSNEVLLIERADHHGYWQSVTGSLNQIDEALHIAAAREVFEETGIDIDQLPEESLQSMNYHINYEIYPEWRHRYPDGVTQNTEHWFKLQLPRKMPIKLSPREHISHQWLDIQSAAKLCFSPSNQEAILRLNSD
jgi:dATP pyrophosphohydrolase